MKAGWEVKPLGEVCDVQSGFAFKSADYCEAGHFLVRIGNVQDGELVLDKPKYVALDGKTRRYELAEGDVLTSLTGNIGRVAVVGKRHLPAALNQRVARLARQNGDMLDEKYFLYFLYSDGFGQPLRDLSHGAAQQNVSPKAISDLPIPIPPLEEQKRIVAVLDAAFEGLTRAKENAETNLQNARELFENTELEIFRKHTGDVSSTTLGNHAEFRNGLNFSKSSTGQTVKIVGVGDFQDHFWMPMDQLKTVAIEGELSEQDSIESGDILAVRSNGNKELIGRVMLAPSVSEPTSFSGFTIRIRITDLDALPEFVCYFMKTKAMRKLLTAGGDGANISNLNQKLLSDLSLRVPSKSVQEVVIEEAKALRRSFDELTDVYQSKLQDIADLRQSLLQKAFAGELT